jgi:hypothetical protein
LKPCHTHMTDGSIHLSVRWNPTNTSKSSAGVFRVTHGTSPRCAEFPGRVLQALLPADSTKAAGGREFVDVTPVTNPPGNDLGQCLPCQPPPHTLRLGLGSRTEGEKKTTSLNGLVDPSLLPLPAPPWPDGLEACLHPSPVDVFPYRLPFGKKESRLLPLSCQGSLKHQGRPLSDLPQARREYKLSV